MGSSTWNICRTQHKNSNRGSLTTHLNIYKLQIKSINYEEINLLAGQRHQYTKLKARPGLKIPRSSEVYTSIRQYRQSWPWSCLLLLPPSWTVWDLTHPQMANLVQNLTMDASSLQTTIPMLLLQPMDTQSYFGQEAQASHKQEYLDKEFQCPYIWVWVWAWLE